MLQLQGAVGNRTVGGLVARTPPGGSTTFTATVGALSATATSAAPRGVQRAILAVDGPTDGKVAKDATANCLANLRRHKKIRQSTGGKSAVEYPAGDARGQVFGPGPKATSMGAIKVGASSIAPLEPIYFLGHGSLKSIAGITPEELAIELTGAFAGYSGGVYAGGLKLVACYSASTMEDGKSATKSYASRVASAIHGIDDSTYRPRFVEGVKGIAWADEETGERVGYETLGERPGLLSPLEQVYDDPTLVKTWLAALTEPDATKRKAEMNRIISELHADTGIDPRVATRMLGKVARERYLAGSAVSDLTVAVDQLDVASGKDPFDAGLARTALKRMRLDWGTMSEVERGTSQSAVVEAYGRYLMKAQARRPSVDAMAKEWPLEDV